jgi:hypothetical protein
MPSTRTKTPSSTQTTVALDAEEFDARGLESSEWSACTAAGDLLPPAAARGRELSPQLIEEALGQGRLRRSLAGMSDEERQELIEALLDQLRDERGELPEKVRDPG